MKDIMGKKFGKLTVIERTNKKDKKGNYFVKCRCDCGNFSEVLRNNLLRGNTKSCGCIVRSPNEFEIKDKYVIIKIKDKEAFVDIEDYEKIKHLRFHLSNKGYAINNFVGMMHRFIIGKIPKNMQIDHINHNKLDNRRENLRICTNQENARNKKCKGYGYNKNRSKWVVRIGLNGKSIYLGSYKKEEDAIRVRKEAEEKYFGDFRYIN